MNDKKRKKLRAILSSIGTPEDVQAVDAAYAAKKATTDRFEALTSRLEKTSSMEDIAKISIELRDVMQQTKSDFSRMVQALTQAHTSSMEDFTTALSGKLEALGSTITTSYEKNKPMNAAGVYKDMINQLAAIDKSVKEKPVPVWNWPQYAGVSVRNKNFANVNPSISPFGIEDFDDVQLSNYDIDGNVGTVEYFLNGQGMGVLTLTYDGSGNLINAERTS